MSLQYPGSSVLKQLYVIIEGQVDIFRDWFKERVVSVNDKELDRLIRLSGGFQSVFVENVGLDEVMAEVFVKLRRGMQTDPATSDSGQKAMKRMMDQYGSWTQRIPASCPKAAKRLDELLGFVDKYLSGGDSSAKVSRPSGSATKRCAC